MPALASAPTRSPPRSARAAWARCTARKTPRLGRKVAVKVLLQYLNANTEVRGRFKREARTISRRSTTRTWVRSGRASERVRRDGRRTHAVADGSPAADREGIVVMPISPPWYQRLKTLDVLIGGFTGKVLALPGEETEAGSRAEELE